MGGHESGRATIGCADLNRKLEFVNATAFPRAIGSRDAIGWAAGIESAKVSGISQREYLTV
jgi:hypothetical protein